MDELNAEKKKKKRKKTHTHKKKALHEQLKPSLPVERKAFLCIRWYFFSGML